MESISDCVMVDTSTQRTTRSCVLGGVTLGDYSIAIESGHALDAGLGLRQELETVFKVPTKYLFLSQGHLKEAPTLQGGEELRPEVEPG